LFDGDGKDKFGPSIPIYDTINFQGGFSRRRFQPRQRPELAIPIQIKSKIAIMLNAK
jgi:hypothetical protein